MSEQLKYIVDEFNKEPFKKNYNLINFDSLQPLQLLQVLNDVFAEINPVNKIDIREEDPEAMAIRMFNFLRVLKFKPKTGAESLALFRQGLVAGEKQVIYPILQWLFERLPDLKKRAYLARYLVRMEIPAELLTDQELYDLNENYVQLIEEFKECHKEAEQMRSSGLSTSEIKKDIAHMEEEHGQLKKRIDRMQRKVETVRNYEQMLIAARNLRVEREEEQSLANQKLEQKNQYLHADQRYQRMSHQLKDLRAQGIGTTGADLIRRLDEENKVNMYLCKDKLPMEIEAKQKYFRDLQKVVNEPAMGQSDLDELNRKIKAMSSEINSLIEKRMVKNDPIDDKLSLFRQQASIIARKKDAATEKLKEAMDENASMENELQRKKDLLRDSEGAEVLKGDEFKRYVNKLRGKSTVYKKKRQEVGNETDQGQQSTVKRRAAKELAELRAEYGVLSRSEEILNSKFEEISIHLDSLESKQGVSGYNDTQEELEKVSTLKSGLDEEKGKTLDDISELVVTMNATIAEKKSALAPIIKELRPMRQKCQKLQKLISKLCLSDAKLADEFLNGVLNQLNWAFSEFIEMLQEIQQATNSLEISLEKRQLRTCAVCFDLTVGLIRVLEMVSTVTPQVFTDWKMQSSELHIARLFQLLTQVLNRITASSNLFDKVTRLHLPGLETVDRFPVLGAVAGILITLLLHGTNESQERATSALLAEPGFTLESVEFLVGGKSSVPCKKSPQNFSFCTSNKDVSPEEVKEVEHLVRYLEEQNVQVQLHKQDSVDVEELCSICYAMKISVRFIPCCHVSCRSCITRHLMNNKECFFCKELVEKLDSTTSKESPSKQ